MILRILFVPLTLFLIVANLHGDRTVFEDVAYGDLAKNPDAFAEKGIRIRAIYSYMFGVSRLKPAECCADRGTSIWVDFDEDKGNDLQRQIPEGMGVVLGTFIGNVETGSAFGPNGERTRLVVNRIEKIEKRAKPSNKN
jgi:hypothetical protein